MEDKSNRREAPPEGDSAANIEHGRHRAEERPEVEAGARCAHCPHAACTGGSVLGLAGGSGGLCSGGLLLPLYAGKPAHFRDLGLHAAQHCVDQRRLGSLSEAAKPERIPGWRVAGANAVFTFTYWLDTGG